MLRTSRTICALLALVVAVGTQVTAADVPITLELLKQREVEVQALVKKVMPATVCIRAVNGGGSGSGVVVSKDGLILTAAHVTAAAGKDLQVLFPDGKRARAKSLGSDSGRDAGMAQIIDKGEYPFAEVGRSETLAENQWCVAIGHAGGFDQKRTPPVRLGRVLANTRWVVTDCTLIGGDSGGPLFDLHGRVIGINSNIGSSLSQNQHVPVDVFIANWGRMLDGETWNSRPAGDLNRPVLGINLDTEPVDNGVPVASVLPGSPAEKAGIKAGDIIQKVNGETVKTRAELIEVVSQKKVGATVKLVGLRGSKSMSFDAKLISVADLMRNVPGRRPQPNKSDEPKPDEPKSEKSEGSDKNDADGDKSEEKKEDTSKKSDGADPSKADSKSKDEAGVPKVQSDETAKSLKENLEKGRANRSPLKLSAKDFEQLRSRLRERTVGRGPARRRKDVFAEQLFKSLQPVVQSAQPSTFRVLVDDKQVALATAVAADGLLVTKASEVDGKKFTVELAKNKVLEGKIDRIVEDYDLAFIRIEADDLKPVDWQSKDDRPLGTIVAAVGSDSEPAAVGVVSVQPRNLREARRGFLGVNLRAAEGGILLIRILPKSPADTAGLKRLDLVISLNGKKIATAEDFVKAVGAREPDDEIELKIRREGKDLEIKVELADRANMAELSGSRQGKMNLMSTRMNNHRSGYPIALQHDTPIEPEETGGPLVDLDGKVIGINIARAGRIKSYAIPASVVRKLQADE